MSLVYIDDFYSDDGIKKISALFSHYGPTIDEQQIRILLEDIEPDALRDHIELAIYEKLNEIWFDSDLSDDFSEDPIDALDKLDPDNDDD